MATGPRAGELVFVPLEQVRCRRVDGVVVTVTIVVAAALLVIADIRGYTPFMKAHRTSLAHAQDVVARLLEAVIDAAPGLTPLEIEGDAAFLYAWSHGTSLGRGGLIE